MSEMVERAAKAIWETWSERARWDERREYHKDETRKEARAALLAALDPEDEALALIAGKALYNSAADRAGRHRPDLDMRPFEQQSDEMQRAWKQDGAAVIAALKATSQGGSVE